MNGLDTGDQAVPPTLRSPEHHVSADTSVIGEKLDRKRGSQTSAFIGAQAEPGEWFRPFYFWYYSKETAALGLESARNEPVVFERQCHC